MKTNTLNTITFKEFENLRLKEFKELCKKHKDWQGVKEISFQELLELFKNDDKMIILINQLCKHRHDHSGKDFIRYSVGKRGTKDKFWCYCTSRTDNYLAFPSNDNNHPSIHIRNRFSSFDLTLKLNLITDLEITKLYDGQEYDFILNYDNKFDYHITVSNKL